MPLPKKFSNNNLSYTLNGVLFTLLFALASMYVAETPWLQHVGISSLVIAIVFGIIYSNTLRHRLPDEWNPGIQFSAKKLLRLAIILYGFRITFQQIMSVGMEGLVLDIIVVSLTLIIGTIIGVKFLKIDKHLALLISSGAAVCGAAAVLAAEDVLKSEPYKAAVAIGTVVLFGTIAMFLYPILQHAGVFGFNDTQFGMFAGASVHEVAQALVTGNNISNDAGNIAIIVKMTRVLLLVPMLIGLSIYESRVTKQKNSAHNKGMPIPWFAVGFAIMIGVNSLQILPLTLVNFINQLDILLLTMAMAAIGMETNFGKIKKVGMHPLYLALILFGWLTVSVFCLVKII